MQEDLETESKIVVKDVESLEISYAYGTGDPFSPYEWREDWEGQKGLPLGVKIKLVVVFDAEKDEHIEFSKYVYISTGKLGEKRFD